MSAREDCRRHVFASARDSIALNAQQVCSRALCTPSRRSGLSRDHIVRNAPRRRPRVVRAFTRCVRRGHAAGHIYGARKSLILVQTSVLSNVSVTFLVILPILVNGARRPWPRRKITELRVTLDRMILATSMVDRRQLSVCCRQAETGGATWHVALYNEKSYVSLKRQTCSEISSLTVNTLCEYSFF